MINVNDYEDEEEKKERKKEEEEEEDLKEIPSSDLDFQYSLVEPSLQRPKKGLKRKFSYKVGEKDYILYDAKTGKPVLNEEGEIQKTTEDIYNELAGNLQFWVRDYRLGNLSQWTGEYEYAIYYINLAADFLSENMPIPALTSLNKALSRLEVSNSKSAKLRELIQTIRKVSVSNVEKESKQDVGATIRKYA